MRIAMVGAGYVGLVTGACFAGAGHAVTCVDSDENKIARLRRGVVPIYELGLDDLIATNVAASRLTFSTDLPSAVSGADFVFLAVGTPELAGDRQADLSQVFSAVASIARNLEGFTILVIKSTVPVGTGDEVEKLIFDINPQADVCIVSNPEFLREGVAIADFLAPDRVVIGLEDERARQPMTSLYRSIDVPRTAMTFTGRRSAEVIKYAANAFLAVKVSFINEVADLCAAAGANIEEVARGVGMDGRIGAKFLNAGPGYGGSCLPKDTASLAQTGKAFGTRQRIVEAAITANDRRKRRIGRRIVEVCGGNLRGRTVGILGLAFKSNTDDVRESPAFAIAEVLLSAGGRLRVWDPKAMDAARPFLQEAEFVTEMYDVADGADCLVIVTEWDVFRSLDFSRLKSLMNTPLLVDLRNLYRRRDIEAHGFAYEDIGRSRPKAGSILESAAR